MSVSAADAISADQPSLFQQGKIAYVGKEYQSAVQYLQQALVNDPANLDISFYLGSAAFELGDYETAVMSFERILIMQPEAMRVKLELARSHMRLGDYEAAKQYFYEVLATNPRRRSAPRSKACSRPLPLPSAAISSAGQLPPGSVMTTTSARLPG